MTRRERSAFTGPNRTGEQRLSFQPKLVRRDLTVARVEDITPRYRRIVLTGEVLAEGYPFVRFACNDHVKAYFPDPRTGHIVAYHETGVDEWILDEVEGEPFRRDYTPRAWDAAARELTLDFVIHEHGIAAAWARAAEPGDQLVVMGLRANWLLPENYSHYWGIGDETALPAISRLIEEAPAGAHVTAMIEIADAREEQALEPAPGVTLDLIWVHRDSVPADEEPGRALLETVRHAPAPGNADDLFVFAAGETTAMKSIRDHLRRDLGLPKRQVAVDGYWKRGIADHDHHTNDFDDG